MAPRGADAKPPRGADVKPLLADEEGGTGEEGGFVAALHTRVKVLVGGGSIQGGEGAGGGGGAYPPAASIQGGGEGGEGAGEGSAYPPTASPSAWWVLFWYSYISALQSLLWMTFSSVPDDSRAWLHTDNGVLDLFLAWGPVGYCVSLGAALLLLSARPDGLRLSVRAAASLCLGASLLRSIPALMSDDARAAHGTAVLACVHVAQFVNGAVAPLVVASPALLSLHWFPEASRNTATAVGNVASALGRGVGFFLGPALVGAASDLPTLLAVEIGLAALPFIAVWAYYPAAPPVPPSRAAEDAAARMEERLAAAAEEEEGKGGGKGAGALHTLVTAVGVAAAEVSAAFRAPAFLALAVAGGLEMAVYGAWSGVLPTVLSPKFSDGQAGTFGSVNTFAGIAGGVLAGWATDRPSLRRHLKGVIQVLALASAALFTLLALAVPPFEQPALADGLGFGALLTICGAAGLLRGGTDPLFFELAAEAVAPVGVAPGAAGGVLTFWYHAILCGMLLVPPPFLNHWTMAAMAAFMVLSAVGLAPVRVAYTRR
jgi:hypothetical protein